MPENDIGLIQNKEKSESMDYDFLRKEAISKNAKDFWRKMDRL